MKRCLTLRIKCDREYAIALNAMVLHVIMSVSLPPLVLRIGIRVSVSDPDSGVSKSGSRDLKKILNVNSPHKKPFLNIKLKCFKKDKPIEFQLKDTGTQYLLYLGISIKYQLTSFGSFA